MVEGGEEDRSCVRTGHRGNCGAIKTTVTHVTISFTHQKSTARCVYCLKPFWCCLPGQRQSLCGGSRWLPCSCHCLSTRKRLPPFSSTLKKSRLRRVSIHGATSSARWAFCLVKQRLAPAKNKMQRYSRIRSVSRGILVTVVVTQRHI